MLIMSKGNVWTRAIAILSLFTVFPARGQNAAPTPARLNSSNRPVGASGATTLIGLGDSLTHGTMDGTNNSINTLHAYLPNRHR